MKIPHSMLYFDHAAIRERNPFYDADTSFGSGMFERVTVRAAGPGQTVELRPDRRKNKGVKR